MNLVRKRSGAFWIGLVFALFGVHMSVAAALVYFAHSDPSFAVVPDYHDKALAWDASRRAEAESDALGWTALLVAGPDSGPVQERDIALTLVGSDGHPITGAAVTIRAFHVARSREVEDIPVQADGRGRYLGRTRFAPAGIWEFEIEASRESERFTHKVRLEMRPGRSASS